MQNDPVLTASDPDNIKSDSPQKYIVASEKSVSTYESDQTGGSKRSTEEEELRSLSTTPRYSHEDLGEKQKMVNPKNVLNTCSRELLKRRIDISFVKVNERSIETYRSFMILV